MIVISLLNHKLVPPIVIVPNTQEQSVSPSLTQRTMILSKPTLHMSGMQVKHAEVQAYSYLTYRSSSAIIQKHKLLLRIQFVFLDIQNIINTVNIGDWANSQYIVDGDKYWIKDLSAWTPPVIDIPGTVADQSSSGMSLVYSWLLFLLILITLWL